VTAAIITAVAIHFGIPRARLISPLRQPGARGARHVAGMVLRFSGLSYPAIARALGLRNHTSVMYGCARVEASPALSEVARKLAARVIFGGPSVAAPWLVAMGAGL
jgi:chromosomal replication initiation ATPase DnaA